jgi:hypothetical protein
VNPPGSSKELWTGEFLVTAGNVNDDATLGLFDPTVQARRVIEKPHFPKRGQP